MNFDWPSFDWLTWSNPVAIWWGFLLVVSVVNIGLWLQLNRHLGQWARARRRGAFGVKLMLVLCAGCGSRGRGAPSSA